MHGPIDQVYRQIRRNRFVEISFVENEEAGISILRSSPALRDLEIRPDRVIAELETDDAGLAQLMDYLIAQGVRMRSFNDRDPTLEDVFMTVTQGLVT
jgi:ABC-2 type transport system ATP-binding protein